MFEQRDKNLLQKRLIGFTLGLITLALFWPCLRHDFLVYDDQQYVSKNPHLLGGLTWQSVHWAFTSFYASNWHPLTWISHLLDCQFYGLRPAGHHFTSLLLHAANTVLLFLVLNRATQAPWRSTAVAALFGWHPLHVESVAWVAERKDVLSGLFFMLTLLAYTEYVTRGEARAVRGGGENSKLKTRNSKLAWPWYCLALFLFTLGLMSKPMLVTLPFVLLLLDYWPLGRFEVRSVNCENPVRSVGGGVQGSRFKVQSSRLGRLVLEKLPFLGLAATSCALTVLAQQRGHTVIPVAGLPMGTRMAHALIAYVHYLGASLLPRNLAVFYPYQRFVPGTEVILAGLVLGGITAVVFRLASARGYLATGWFWYLGTLVPVLGLVQVGDQAWADRYTYLPLIGWFIFAVWGVADLAQSIASGATKMVKPLLTGVAISVSLALVTATSFQIRYWKNTRALFEHAGSVTHGNSLAITVLGSLLAEEGKLDQAMDRYRLALSYSPGYPEAHFAAGQVLDQQGKLDDAMVEYRQALAFPRLEEPAHIALGKDLARLTKNKEAATHYEAALALNPESAAALNNLARLLHSEGRLDEAIQKYSLAVKFDPGLAEAHNNLGVLLLQTGRVDEGVAHLRTALRLKPGDGETEYNLAMALNQQRQWAEAVKLFSKLVASRPQHANLYCQFGLALARLGRTREAMSSYAHALLLQPDFPQALDGLAWIASTDPHPELRNGTEAVRMAERACELTNRKDPEKLMTLAATYAESGRFPEAIATAEGARRLAVESGQKDVSSRCRRLAEAFSLGVAWRESAPPEASKP